MNEPIVDGVEFRRHPEFSDYLIGTDGSVWSCKKYTPVRILGWTTAKGYQKVELTIPRKQRSFYVHRAVLETFVGKRPEGFVCRHLDGNPQNNALSNLRWGTPKENTQDTILHGRLAVGSRSGSTKLTEEDVVKIRLRVASGETQRSIMRDFDISDCTVSCIVNRLRWRHI